jgi:hypothetical protein
VRDKIKLRGFLTMNTDLNQNVCVSLSKAACLVLFELLNQSYEDWRESNPDDSSAGPMLINAGETAQRMALWQLEGSLEKTLPELFFPKYDELLAEAKRVVSHPAGSL